MAKIWGKILNMKEPINVLHIKKLRPKSVTY